MRAYIITLAALLALFLAAFPVFAEETEEAKPKEGEKTVIIKMTSDGECTEISSSDGEGSKIILDCVECDGEEGVKKIIINCPEGECPDLSDLEAGMEELEVELGELGCKIEIEELAGEEGTIKKKIVICPDGEFPDMGKV
ncbi:MAG: hypothetical protein GY771_14605, partial [bacterium]|nr:hypothetical protein [bacterium]